MPLSWDCGLQNAIFACFACMSVVTFL